MAKEYRLENDLKKTIPLQGSKRYERLLKVCWEKGWYPSVRCEFCNSWLLNPQSILIHQGTGCRKKLDNNKIK